MYVYAFARFFFARSFVLMILQFLYAFNAFFCKGAHLCLNCSARKNCNKSASYI